MTTNALPTKASRSVAIDWMRGIVMVLMTIDHASLFYNGGRVADDSAVSYVIGSALPTAQFFTRWITHLCAPTFVFLTGTSLALSVARKQSVGLSEASISRDFYIRGAFIALLDVFYVSSLAQHLLLQVLYAIGVSMMLMGVLRRLPTRVSLALSLAGIVGGELVTLTLWDPHGAPASLPVALTLAPLFSKSLLVIYPVLPWLWLMLLGWTFGRLLLRPSSIALSPIRVLTWSGVASLLLYALIRFENGYGNVRLYREDNSVVQWLHVSKYPPGLAYVTLELGIMALCLVALMKLERRVTANAQHPILLFGQTSLFFYVMHQLLLGVPATVLGIRGKGGLLDAYVAAVIALCLLYPLCRWFRGLKSRHPNSLLRYV